MQKIGLKSRFASMIAHFVDKGFDLHLPQRANYGIDAVETGGKQLSTGQLHPIGSNPSDDGNKK